MEAMLQVALHKSATVATYQAMAIVPNRQVQVVAHQLVGLVLAAKFTQTRQLYP